MGIPAPLRQDIDFSTAPLPDLHAVLDARREQGAVVPVRFHGAPCWLITRFAELRQAFSDEEHFPSEAAYRIHSEPSMGRTMQTMSGEMHRVNRALVSNAFFPKAVRAFDQLPGPRPWPVVGNLWPIEPTRMHLQLQDWCTDYGTMYRLRPGPRRVLVRAGALEAVE